MNHPVDSKHTETKTYANGVRMVRRVSIKDGKGYKSITKYRKGKKMYTVKKPIHEDHLKMINGGKFVVGLFNDCINCKTKKNR